MDQFSQVPVSNNNVDDFDVRDTYYDNIVRGDAEKDSNIKPTTSGFDFERMWRTSQFCSPLSMTNNVWGYKSGVADELVCRYDRERHSETSVVKNVGLRGGNGNKEIGRAHV